ncbi:MAG: c-type cytochrome [Gammaproteobacteria bacterium]
MKKNVLALTIALASTITPGLSPAGEGDAASGKAKTAACANCHGVTGNSAMPLFPKLAGQHVKYLTNQMMAFKDGSRDNPMMKSMVMSLSDKDMNDISAFYSVQRISSNSLPVVESDEDEEEENDEEGAEAVDMQELLALGSDLYRNGNVETEVSACIACHGPFGEGNKPAGFPMLKSQHADYLIKSLNDFKSGSRSKNPDNMMNMIAKKMSEKEIRAVSYYISMIK